MRAAGVHMVSVLRPGDAQPRLLDAIEVQMDGAWHTRGWDSNSGTFTLYAMFRGVKYLIFELLVTRTCNRCEHHERKGVDPPPDLCIRNAAGLSAKGFEAAAFMAGVPELCASGFIFKAVRADGDTAMLAALKADPKWAWWTKDRCESTLCANHVLKNKPKHLAVRYCTARTASFKHVSRQLPCMRLPNVTAAVVFVDSMKLQAQRIQRARLMHCHISWLKLAVLPDLTEPACGPRLPAVHFCESCTVRMLQWAAPCGACRALPTDHLSARLAGCYRVVYCLAASSTVVSQFSNAGMAAAACAQRAPHEALLRQNVHVLPADHLLSQAEPV